MRFNLITYMNYPFGLGWDYNLLKNLLEGWGHEVRGVDLRSIEGNWEGPVEDADVNIFLELLSGPLFKFAKQNWFIPNQEWYHAQWDRWLPGLDKLLCKTHEAYNAFASRVPDEKRIHIGFESRDLYDPTIPRKKKFLHVAGGSASKNTTAVAYAFAKFFNDPYDKDCNQELVLVSRDCNHNNLLRDRKNCQYIEKAGDEELRILMNECTYHIMPSGAEGWGHVIHEGLGCGAVMITTDFPPMNESTGIDRRYLVATPKWDPMNAIGRFAWVGALQVKAAVEQAAQMWNTRDRLQAIQDKARASFLIDREFFRQKFKELVDNV